MLKSYYFAFIFFVFSCASSPTQNAENAEYVSSIINSTHIKKPIRRTVKDSEEIIKRIESKIMPSIYSYCEENGISCNWSLEQEINTSFNAYATIEDGESKIVLFTGLISGVHYEEELAFVIAHEIGHHLANHINEAKMTTYAGMLLGGAIGATVGDPVSGALYGGSIGRNSFSINQENEADKIAANILLDSGYDLEKAKMVLLRMSRMSSQFYTVWMSSHPSGPDRILNFKKNIYEE